MLNAGDWVQECKKKDKQKSKNTVGREAKKNGENEEK